MQNWPEPLIQNLDLLSDEEKYLATLLVENGQQHLFTQWSSPGDNDLLKHKFFLQVKSLHESYMPQHGGLAAYIKNARKLLADSKNGLNPLDNWTPEVPEGINITPTTPEYDMYDIYGGNDLSKCGFVLVAGGLGERLGYNGIKIELPTETTTGLCYIELYCQQILAIQKRYSERSSDGSIAYIPLAIMVSDDTCARTEALLQQRGNFGMCEGQITLLRQGKVPALLDNDARLALDGPYVLSAKPHGHGDVHALMHSTGTAARWAASGVAWCYFFQDTNGLALYSLSAMLGVSMKLSLEVNSRGVPRVAKQAVGAIVRLVEQSTGRAMTVNVEYNQLDPLLRSTTSPSGDVNDPSTGHSIYPGNINQLLFSMPEYLCVLSRTHGVLGEFVNPKYVDSARQKFKKPTRLECMMQDYPKVLDASARVGFTTSPAWACYSPVKNCTVDAAASVANGVPAGCAMTGESDQYMYWLHLLNSMGASVAAGPTVTILGITGCLSPLPVFHPSFVVFPMEAAGRFPTPQNVHISSRSSLVVKGNVIIESLALDGALVICNASDDHVLTIRCDLSDPIINVGYEVSVIPTDHLDSFPEVTRMRGFEVKKKGHVIIDMCANASRDVVLTSAEINSEYGTSALPPFVVRITSIEESGQQQLLHSRALPLTARVAATGTNKHVLVTGGAGFIGSHTIISLIESGYAITVVDNLVNSSEESLRRVREITGCNEDQICFFPVDICNREAMEAVFLASPTFIACIHCAGLKAVGESVKKPLLYYENNLASTIVLLELMDKYDCRHLVFSSSATVYGSKDYNIREDSPTGAGITNAYGRTKYMIEEILRDFKTSKRSVKDSEGDSWSICVLRFFNPIGAHPSGKIGEDPNGPPNNLTPFVAQVAVGKREKLTVFGADYPTPDGTGVRDYVHVMDMAEGHVAALRYMESHAPGYYVFNLGSGRGVSVLEMVRAVEQACGYTIPYEVGPRREGDTAVCYADTSKAKNELGWEATRSLDEACADLWRWQSSNPNGYS